MTKPITVEKIKASAKPDYTGLFRPVTDIRFSGKRVRQDSRRLKNIRARDRRLRRHGLSVVLFKS